MSLGEKIKDDFKADESTILSDNLDRAKGLFKYHNDGTISLSSSVRETPTKIRIIVYLIAKRLMFEADDAETESLTNSYFYDKFDVAESSIRAYIMDLRNDGLVRSEEGEHNIVVENLPRSFDMIEAAIES